MALLPPVWIKYKGVTAGAALFVLLLLIPAVWGSRGLLHLRRLQEQQRELEATAIRLQQQNDDLRTHLRRLRSDDRYLERVVRQRLGWVKPGEILYRLPRADRRRDTDRKIP